MFTFFVDCYRAILVGLTLHELSNRLSARYQATPEFHLNALRAAVQELTAPSLSPAPVLMRDATIFETPTAAA